MAQAARQDDKNLPKLAQKSLQTLARLLVLIGKPLYYLFSYAIIFLLFSSYYIGSATKGILKLLFKTVLSLLKNISSLKELAPPKPAELPLPYLKTKIPKPKVTFFIFILLLLILFLPFYLFVSKDLPTSSDLINRDLEVSTKIYDRNGTLLYKIYKDKNRTIVPLGEIPIQVRLATLAAEDAEFYYHPGFSIRGIIRSTVRNATRGELTGGSTITQQLVKNALLSSEKTLLRKLREIVLAIKVEVAFEKDKILEMYLNEVSYGGTAYGIQEAARLYFGKNADKLTLSEAALLAGLPKSPTKYSPFGPTPDEGLKRQKEVLNLMAINKFITPEQQKRALEEQLKFAENKIDIKAPHFVMYVRQALVEEYGEEVVEKGGLEVVTTLDYSVQKMAEGAVKSEVDKLSSLKVGNGAALVINPTTGEILAMVGSKDYFNTQADGNVNVTTSPRQPGSSIKVVNYAYALSNGYTPASILKDTPITFSIPGQKSYSPKNYDSKFRGSISLRSALAESRNVPAVKVLASYGVAKMVAMGKAMGITTWDDPTRYGLSLTLGGGEVKLIDLARAYATIANYGVKQELVSVLKITNYKGRVIKEHVCPKENTIKLVNLIKPIEAAQATITPCKGEKVVDPRVSFLLIDILRDNAARAPAFGTNSLLVIPKHSEVAVKTGTSNDLRDNLTVGFTKDYLVTVWVGNNDNSPMSRVASGVTGATPIWNKIMTALLAAKENHKWEVPEGLVRLPICSLTGTLACRGCSTQSEWFLKETSPTQKCKFEDVLEKRVEEEKEKRGRILEPAWQTER